jgi:hypothetical protein
LGLLCLYCHDNEHQNWLEAATSAGGKSSEAGGDALAFATLKAMLEEKGRRQPPPRPRYRRRVVGWPDNNGIANIRWMSRNARPSNGRCNHLPASKSFGSPEGLEEQAELSDPPSEEDRERDAGAAHELRGRIGDLDG